MALATVFSRANIGVSAPLVTVEVHIANGLPGFQIVGLPDATVKEAKDRVKSALINSNFLFPQTKVTVNLSPADSQKQGARFDLAIAVGILVATKQLTDKQVADFEFYGELGLDGSIRPIIAELPVALACRNNNKCCVLPKDNAPLATKASELNILSPVSLIELFHHLSGQQSLPFYESYVNADIPFVEPPADLSDIIGQPHAKRALEIAAAGKHNLLLVGPPGSGKSMLASRLPTILPPLSESEALESAAIYSISGKAINFNHWQTPSFRSPHHTASGVALVGGGSNPKPGEISLAHKGVLFLDELPEFERKVLDVLREPLETGSISISRANQQVEFPAQFQLVAALNPSPTGDINDGRSNPDQILRYLQKISGPLLDRIDIQVEVPALPKGSLWQQTHNHVETSRKIKQRVMAAHKKMMARAGKANAYLTNRELHQHCKLTGKQQNILEVQMDKRNLSVRVIHKLIKVARTIADLDDSEKIQDQHLAEALGYRAMDTLLSHLQNMAKVC